MPHISNRYVATQNTYNARNHARRWASFGVAAAFAALMLSPNLAHATSASSSMPYSQGLNTLSDSLKGEVALVLITICIVCGVGGYIMQGQLTGLMETIGRVFIGIGIIGSIGTVLAVVGISGAVI